MSGRLTPRPGTALATRYRCALAVLPGEEVAADVLVEVTDGRIAAVEVGAPVGPGEERLAGLVLPGLANAHSHAFHRALRGRTHGGQGTFWTWRERMYAIAERLDPDSYLALARATFAEMALAGFTTVGEFHYLHHGPDGRPYDDANAMGLAVVAAAREAGLRIALLDTCYLAGGIGAVEGAPGQRAPRAQVRAPIKGAPGQRAPLEGAQRRFGDSDVAAWAERADALAATVAHDTGVVVGAAAHSVRAVPADALPEVVAWAALHGAPLHAHVSEQPAENDACRAAYGATPTRVLADAGFLGPRATAVHGTHLTDADVAVLGGSGTSVCLCPSTEADLADGVGPARALLDAGAPITLGSDSQAVIDGFAEARAVELGLRLVTGRRGAVSGRELLAALTRAGHASLGFPDAGVLAPGARADLVAVRMDSVRTAPGPVDDTAAAVDLVVFAASAADVTDVIIDGRRVVRDGEHVLGDVGRLLGAALTPLLDGGGR